MPTLENVLRLRLRLILGMALLVALAGCGQGAAPAPASSGSAASKTQAQVAAPAEKPSGWDQLVAAAKKEGAITVFGPPGPDSRAALVDDFQAAYPDIKVTFSGGTFTDEWARVSAERATGKYLLDVVIGAASSGPTVLKPAGALQPLQPLLMLPEVTDTSNWFQHRLWWEDEHEPHTSLGYQANVQLIVAYNKNLVPDPKQFISYADLLDPKWKGKMVSSDIRPGQVGGVSARYLYRQPGLGPEFLSKLYSEQRVTVSADQRQLIDWLGSGQFALGLFLSPDPTVAAINQGLPIGYVPGEQFKEGAPLGPSRGTIDVMDKPPHPNTTKVFVNWLLSKPGQMAWQNRFKAPSLRTDIPKDGIFPLFVPREGGNYVDGSTRSFNNDELRATMQDMLDKAMAKGKASGA